MLRHIIRNFQKVLILTPPTSSATNSALSPCNSVFTRTLFQVEKSTAKTITAAEDDVDGDIEDSAITTSEYIIPYRVDHEKKSRSDVFLNALRSRFRLTPVDVKRIMCDEVVYRAHKERSLLSTLEALCYEGVTKRSFMDYPWLITLDKDRLQRKMTIIHSMSMKDINHFVCFLRLTLPRLNKVVSSLNSESDKMPGGNRVYYISQRLNIDPYIVTKYLHKRLFVLEMPFDMFEQNLQHMMDYNVSPTNMLRDLWAFRYTPKSVQLRLERARRAKKDKIMPWMVRCPEPILQRSLKISIDELAILGNKTSAVEYVAERLNFDVNETQAIMNKHPQVNRVRVTKIKEVLDYLLNEAGFTRHEIAQVPRILCHSLKTTKKRLDELKSYGCRPTTLVIVCRSRREYDKFVKAWLNMSNKGYVPTISNSPNQLQQSTDTSST